MMLSKVCALLFTGATALLLAQGERGTLNGTVTDPTGALIPAASVKAVNVATGIETTAVTTSAGVFRLPYLQPGTYKVTVTSAGFRTATRDNVILGVAQTLTVDFQLSVGAVSDEVTISAEPPLLETGTAEIGSYVTKKEFDTWPITVGDGRRQIQQFIFSSLPGAVGSTWQGSINGGQNFSHEILIDGIAIGRMDLQGGANNEFSPSAESVSEFKLQTGTVSAQYGGGQTSVANFATKSGTNDLHGSAYYYIQNDALRSNGYNNNASNIRRQPFKQHNYGWSAGGPVWLPKLYNGRNRSFWFGNFERTIQRNFVSTGFSTLPMPDYKRGDFSRILNPAFTGNARSGGAAGTDALGNPVMFGAIFDPASTAAVPDSAARGVRTPFPGNLIPRSRWSPVASRILEQAPIDDPAFNTMLNNIPNLGACCPIFDEKMLTFKGDHMISPAHRLSGLFNRNFRERNNSPGGRWGLPPGSPTNVYQLQNTPGTMARLAWDGTLRSNLLNRFAIGYNRFGNINQSVHVDGGWPEKVGYQNLPGRHFPPLVFSGLPFQGGGIGAGGRLGSANAGGSFNGSTILQNDLTWIKGAHNIKVGWEQRRYYYNTRPLGNESGTFNFSPAQTAQLGFNNETGHSFASFLLGAVSSTNRNVVASFFGHRWRSNAFYFMDDWKVNKKLTLNVGLRWEVIGGLSEVAGRMSGLDFSLANPGAGNRLGALVFLDEKGRTSFQNRYWWQMAPKFGFAYAANQKLVLRGGFGMNNTPPISNGFGFGGTLGYNGAIALSAANVALNFGEDPVFSLHQRYPDFAGALPNRNPALSNGLGVNYIAPDSNRLAYTMNWNLGFQYQLPKQMVLEMNYVANVGRRLEAGGLDNLNQLPVSVLSRGNALLDPWSPASGVAQPFPGFTGTVLQALRPYPQFTSIGQVFANFGTSSYNSMQVQLTRHFRNGLSLLGAYTWSKALGLNDSAIDDQGAADVFNRANERSILGFNFPHFFKFTYIYELPIGNGKLIPLKGVANTLFGGWAVTGIHQIRSGSPLSIGGGPINNPLGAARADLVTGQQIVTNSGAPINFRGFTGGQSYLNRAAFAFPDVHPGGRNVMTRLGTLGRWLPATRGPHFTYEDLAISKTWKFTESKSFEMRGTFLNPFNRVGRGNPDTNLASPFFGQITGQQLGGRNIEIMARIAF